ncbi:hypothetical protein BHM03_00020937 [Ensete ventricosum]|uniref:Uncharacterized protein n=1 Tax=Ensete ventricosum TaxID=4639 RepID=A0A426ZT41_ENSVE|nr:hypothetical protein B296_00031221 [Ensete ventricosum]RZR92607.1 hypothetical protein BHM03_00020937 [Ensete ventricosum]
MIKCRKTRERRIMLQQGGTELLSYVDHSLALTDPYFKGLAKVEREPSRKPIRKMEFEFEQLRLTKEEIQELIFREILEYHPKLLSDYLNGMERAKFLYPRFDLHNTFSSRI